MTKTKCEGAHNDAANSGIKRLRQGVTLAVASLVLSVGSALAEPVNSVASGVRAGFEDMQSTALTGKNGAPVGAYAFAQTPDGFLWIGTATGLYRYDGATFTQPWAGRLNGVSIVALFADPGGDLWVGYIFGGIDRLHAGRVINYPVAQLPGGSTLSFVRAPDGTLWVSCFRGLARFDGQRWISGKAMGYSGERPRWMGSSQDKLIVLTDTAAFQLRHGASRFEPMDRLAARQARWGSPPHPAWRPEELAAFGDESDDREILLDHTGTLWTNDKLFVRRLRWPGGADRPVIEEAPLDEQVAAEVMSIFEDREGNVWIGTGSGVERFSHSRLRRLQTVRTNGRAPLVIPRDDTKVWISGYDIPTATPDGTAVTSPPLGQHIVTYARAHDGSLWLAGDLGVLHYTRAGTVEKAPALPLDPAALRDLETSLRWQSIAEDDGGVIWLSAVGYGQFCLRDGAWSAPDPALGLPTRTAIRLLADERRRLWLTYPDNRVAVVAGGHSRMYTRADGVSIGNPTAIAVRGNHVWLGGDRGVGALINDRFTPLRGRSGETYPGTAGIIETTGGEVWLNTAQGVVRIKSESVGRFLAGDATPVDFDLFDWHDSLEGGGPMLRPSPNLLQMPDGRIWLSRMSGVWWVDPSNIFSNQVAPLVQVDRVVRDGEHVRVDYTATSLTSPDRVRFRYRLEGMNESWQEAGSRRQAYYTNLAPGRYTFKVTAANEDGVWTDKIATAAFTISPAFYQTSWFVAVCIAAGLAALWLIYLLRIRHLAREFDLTLEARLNERERIARELHDTLLQSFHGLLLQLQTAYKLLPAHPDKAKQTLESTIDGAAEAATEGRDTVQGLRASLAAGNDLAAAIKTLGEELAGRSIAQRSPELQVDVTGAPRTLRPIVRDEIYRVAGEALRNAFRHAGANRIEVDLCYDERQLRLRVRDDGNGTDLRFMRAESPSGHYGIHGMRERAKLMGGSLSIWTAANSGTEVELRVPASRAYATSSADRRPWLLGKLFGARIPIES